MTHREDPMPRKAKIVLIWIGMIFLIYAIVQTPDRAADVVLSIVDVFVNAVTSIFDFLGNLLQGS